MDNLLIKHALEDVWCSPRQDNQWVVEPKRVSAPIGALAYANLLGSMRKLPDNNRYYHVFHVGQVDPGVFNLISQRPEWDVDKWFKFSDAMMEAGMEVTIYNDAGVNIPRTDSYYIYTRDRCLFFIVPNLKKIPVALETDRIFFRFYSNAAIGRKTPDSNKYIEVGSFKPLSINDILAIEAIMEIKDGLPGKVSYYVNGLLTNNFNLGNVKTGDILEYVLDTSVKKTLRWKIADLFNFRSEIDNVRKYLLHDEGHNNFEIDYLDDLDVHVVIDRPGQFKRGVYFNRNKLKNHRMITHKDYAIDSNMAMGLRNRLQTMLGLSVLSTDHAFIELTFRDAKTDRTLGFEKHRIRELYKLPDANVVQCLNGVNATVPEWYCANLEKSETIEMMSRKWTEFDIALVENGYGYNAISKIIGDTPSRMQASGSTYVTELPHGAQVSSTVYEFDEGGLLLGWHPHINGVNYTARDPKTRLVEAIVGVGGTTSNSVYGKTNIPIIDGWDYRVYRCTEKDGIPDDQWKDITGSTLYAIENEKVVWKSVEQDQWLCVRVDNKFITYDTQVAHSSGLLNFVVAENPTGNPVDELESVHIPFAQLDVWMNGYKLIRNLDYFVKWPLVIVTNKTYLKPGPLSTLQDFHVRASRLAVDMVLDKIEEHGWVYHRSLSNNNVFDLRDDRVMQINIGGRLMSREGLVFAEDRPTPKIIDALNGFPYQIKDIIVPFQRFTETSAYDLRPEAQKTDINVSAYLTEYYGDMEPDGVSSIGPRYPVVSPFLSHLVYLLVNHQLDIPPDRHLLDYEVRDFVRPHEWLLELDPLNAEAKPDIRFAYVLPHGSRDVQVLDFVAYRFFMKVVEFYGYEGLIYKEYLAIG